MDKRSKKHKGHAIAAATLAAGLSLGVTGTAMATVVSVGGGTWDYGIMSVLPGTNWSNYYHPSRVHGSSVTGDVGLVRSVCVAGGNTSYANAYDSNPLRIDQAYWRYC